MGVLSRRRNKKKDWLAETVRYWEIRQTEVGLGVDWAEAHERCWRCGYEAQLQRCHIVPVSLGGTDDVNNIVALCTRCHDEAPNVNDATEMWCWLRKTAVPIYDTYWPRRALNEVLKELNLSDEELARIDVKKFRLLVKEISMNEVGLHCGQCCGGVHVTLSSYAWAIRKAFLKALEIAA